MGEFDSVLRAAWPLAVAATARATRDLDLAEDATQEAVERALCTWGATPPENPAGWLTTTARRIALDRLRREARLRRKLPLLVEPSNRTSEPDEPEPLDPLRLVLACCHPALARESQIALTLRLVCGLDVPAIAAVLLSGQAGVARRIGRAKQKIATARIPFQVPPDEELPARLDVVLTVIHLVYTAGHTAGGTTLRDDGLVQRALELAHLLVRLVPGEPEPRGLLGLVLLTEARKPVRTDPDGDLVLLPEQDRSRWDRAAIHRGLALATGALRHERRGRFALQAGIAGLHAVAPSWTSTDWAQLVATYDALLALWPSPVAALNRAAARSRIPGTDLAAALLEVDALAPALAEYRYLPVLQADLLARIGHHTEANAARERALNLCPNSVERRHLALQRAHISPAN